MATYSSHSFEIINDVIHRVIDRVLEVQGAHESVGADDHGAQYKDAATQMAQYRSQGKDFSFMVYARY